MLARAEGAGARLRVQVLRVVLLRVLDLVLRVVVLVVVVVVLLLLGEPAEGAAAEATQLVCQTEVSGALGRGSGSVGMRP
mgnify:CR=1 FL=1